MREKMTAFFCGTLFAMGLGISQMTRPPKILGFLNVLGNWDPTLLVVFASATLVYLIGYTFFISPSIKGPIESYLDGKERIEDRVIVGSVLFGVGWGLVGLCPGPALTDLITLKPQIFIFAAAMLAGMQIQKSISYYISK